MSSRLLRIISLAAFCSVGVLLIGYHSPWAASADVKAAKDRTAAQDFTLKDANGATIKLSAYKGKVVLLNFWATWCGPCRVEIPWFGEFENKYKAQGFAVLGVSMDEDGWEAVRPYMRRIGMNYTSVIADQTVIQRYGGLESLPETLMIDREGRIAARHVGITEKGNYESEIVELLRR